MIPAIGQDPSPTPSPITPPPCSAHADRWFDRNYRTHALSTCLSCPVRPWCAREAIATGASWGTWAGVWIDRRSQAVVDQLRAIAADDLAINAKVNATASATAPPAFDCRRPPLPRLERRSSANTRSVQESVLVRSSGHCEILGLGCHLSADIQLSRVRGLPVAVAHAVPVVYMACRPCSDTHVAQLDHGEARRLGFVADSPTGAATTPFRWRGTRWVIFGPGGELHEVADDHGQLAHAS